MNANRVLLIGNAVTDPDLRVFSGSHTRCRFPLGTSRRFRRKDGTRGEDTVYVLVESWGPLAEACGRWMKRGRPVMVQGRLKQDRWKRPDGSPASRIIVLALEVQFLYGVEARCRWHPLRPGVDPRPSLDDEDEVFEIETGVGER